MTTKNSFQERGFQAESIASEYLIAHGYTILKRNLHTRYGEIDILAIKDGEYIGAEVKSRSQPSFLPPELNITPHKYSKMVRSLLSLADLQNKPTRIDVITVEGKKVRRHFKAVEYPASLL